MTLLPTFRSQWFRLSVLALMVAALIIYVGRSIRNLQYRLLYYPSSSTPPDQLLRANNMALWRASGADYRGLAALNPPGSGKGTVVVFHGNGGSAADRGFYLDALGALGYRVVLAEYPMYGGRTGELGERSFVGDARESIRFALEDFGGPLFILGESLGCGIAAAAAREAPVPIHGVILITPWDTLASVAKGKFPFLPVRLLLRDEYDTVRNLGSFQGRIVVVGAGRDEVIPVEHAGKLYDSLPGTAKKLWIFQEAGHNDWYRFASVDWWRDVMEFAGGGSGIFQAPPY
ncbi:MAG: alpha/beta fold hydrolase [Syntrophobacter sp.]